MSAICLGACGHSQKSTSAADTQAPVGTSTTTPASEPVKEVQVNPADERVVIARVAGTPITKATFERLKASQTPKVANYEPRSREVCSSVRAPAEVSSPKPVNGRPPTLAELERQCKAEKAEEIKQSVLHHLIVSEWVIHEAAQLGLGVSEQQAQAQVQQDKHKQFASEAQFKKYLSEKGSTEAEIRFDIKTQLAEERLRERIKRSVGKLTPEQIAAYYDAHKAKYLKPEQRDIEAIRTWTRPVIEKARREILAGASFGELARRVSIDHPSSENDGVTLGVQPGQEEKGLDQAIFAAKPNALVGPLHLRRRYYIFEVKAIHPAIQTPFAQIEASITKEVEEARQKQAVVRFIAAWRRKWRAQTDCSAGYVVARCRQYKAPKGQPVEEDAYTFD